MSNEAIKLARAVKTVKGEPSINCYYLPIMRTKIGNAGRVSKPWLTIKAYRSILFNAATPSLRKLS